MKHEVFCHQYIKFSGNQRKAYLYVYPESKPESADAQAHKLMRNNQVIARIDELKQELLESEVITKQELIRDLKEIKNRCMQNIPVMEYDKSEGKMVHNGEYQFKEQGALKAVELMGKMIAVFTDNVNMEHSGTVETKPVNVTTGDGKIIDTVE